MQRFVNSIDLETGEDELDSPAALGRWLAERQLLVPGARVTAADLRRAVDVREGLRALMLQNNGLELDASKVERLDAAAGRAGVRVRFRDGEEPRLEPSSGGVDGAIGRLLAIAATAAQNGTWRRLKACPREECGGPSTTIPRTARAAGAGWRLRQPREGARCSRTKRAGAS